MSRMGECLLSSWETEAAILDSGVCIKKEQACRHQPGYLSGYRQALHDLLTLVIS